MPYEIRLRKTKGIPRIEFYSIVGSKTPDLVLNVDHEQLLDFLKPYLLSDNVARYDRRRKSIIIGDRSLFEKTIILASLLMSCRRRKNDRFIMELIEGLGGYDIHFWASNIMELYSKTRNPRSIQRVIKAFKILYQLA